MTEPETSAVPPIEGGAGWRLRLSGAVQASGPEGRVHALSWRDGALLAWLAIEGPTPRARLAALLWPDGTAESARNSLRQRLFQLRRQLGAEIVVGSAALALADGVVHDLDDSDTVLGDITADTLAAGEFASWLERQRDRRRSRERQALVDLCEMAEAAKDFADALTHAQELLALEPLSEAAHRRVMRLHYLAGDRAAALLAFDRCERMLKDEVGARPSAETLALLRTVETATHAALPPARSAPRHSPAALLRPPRLIGRDRELAQLADGLVAGQTAFVIGEAGMGKTRMLEELRDSAPGWLYVSARPGDASVPFASIARVLRAVAARERTTGWVIEPTQRRELARLLPEIDDGPPRAPTGGHRLVLEQAVQGYLATQDTLKGLLLDDLHFADRASLDLLSTLLARGGAPSPGPPPCVLAFRPAEAGSPLVALQDVLLDQLSLVTVSLAPLDEPALAGLIDSLGVPELDGRTLAAAVHRRSGGNPMFVIETLKQAWHDGSLARVGRPDAHMPAPASIGRLIERRLAQLSPAALALARVASIAGLDFEIGLAEQVLATSAMRLADAINELEAAQVLRGSAFAHDLVFETVRAGVPAAVAVHTHAQVAAWIEAHGGEPARLAEHWVAGRQPARAIAPLLEAASRCEDRTAFAEAMRLAERAAALCADLGLIEQELEALDQVTWYCTFDDPGPRSDAAAARMAAIARTESERLCATVAGLRVLRRRQTLPPAAGLHEWIDTALRLGDVDRAATLLVICSHAHHVQGEPDGALAVLEKYRHLLDGTHGESDLATLFGNLGSSLAGLDRFAEAIELNERASVIEREQGNAAELMRSLVNRTRYYRAQGRMHTARAAFEEIERWHAADAPNPQSRSMVGCSHAEVLTELELFDEALTSVERDVDVGMRAAGGLSLAWPVARAKIWLPLGQPARARQALQAGEAMLDDAPDWLVARWLLLQAQTEARLHGERPARVGETALRLLERAARAAPKNHRRLSWFECELQRAAWSAPGDGAARAELVASLAQQQGMIGHAMHARFRTAERLLADGRLDEARHMLTQARALSRWRFADAPAEEVVFPSGGTRSECELIELQVLQAAGAPDVASRAAAAVERLKSVAQQQVPAEFRDGFLHRNPVHLELQALAARLAAG